VLHPRIEAFLNSGDSVVAEVPTEQPAIRRFVRIRPLAKPGVPREEHRYLNSPWSMWEYWDFEFRRFTLRSGWEQDEWNYDRYLIEDSRRLTVDPSSFQRTLAEWVPDVSSFRHVSESECPE
jgi:hypothetical protein